MTPDRGAVPYGPAGRPPGRRSWAADGALAPRRAGPRPCRAPGAVPPGRRAV